jgi:hypothetical protein
LRSSSPLEKPLAPPAAAKASKASIRSRVLAAVSRIHRSLVSASTPRTD